MKFCGLDVMPSQYKAQVATRPLRPAPTLSSSLTNAVDEEFDHQEQWVSWGLRNRERYENLFNVDILKGNLWEYFLHQGMAEDENT